MKFLRIQKKTDIKDASSVLFSNGFEIASEGIASIFFHRSDNFFLQKKEPYIYFETLI
jgi:hypothetical protein